MTSSVLGSGSRPLWRRVALPVSVAAPFVALAGYVATVSPFTHHYVSCPVLGMFGVFCPGCGGLRAVHTLAHGDVVGALGLNAYGVAFVAVTGGVWLWWLVTRARGRPLRSRLVPLLLFGLLAALPVFAVVRNLPFGQILAP